MKLVRPDMEEGAAGLRAIVSVARSGGDVPTPTERLIAAAQKFFLGSHEPLGSIEDISPAALAATVERPELRLQLVNGMVVASMAAGPPRAEQAELVRRYADALEVTAPQIDAVEKLAAQDVFLYKLCVLRNGHMPDMLKDQYHHGGLSGLVTGLMGLRGFYENPAVTAPFLSWEKLPADTLGARVFRHYREHGFALPGEKGGFPEAGMYHDFSHVLAGYDTSPQGETLVAAFIGGYREDRPDHGLFTVLFALSIFSTGVDVTPIGVGASTGTVGDVAERFFEALDRGSQMPIDLSKDWNFWDYIEMPLQRAREELGIPSKVASGPGDYPD